MKYFRHQRRVAAFLKRTGLHSLVERHHHEREQHQAQTHARPRATWRTVLHRLRLSFAYPVLAAVLALVSGATGFPPYGPVLVVAVVFAPERWRSTYLAACLGTATGAMLLALTIESVGGHFVAQYIPGLQQSMEWTLLEQWVSAYGSLALFAIAALPLPEIPPLVILALAKTPLPEIWLAVFFGRLCKYGIYIAGIRLILKALHLERLNASTRK